MLTDAQCRNATCPPDKKRERLTDSAGLYLEISPAGSKRWFQKIYRDGKETRLALGSLSQDKGIRFLLHKQETRRKLEQQIERDRTAG